MAPCPLSRLLCVLILAIAAAAVSGRPANAQSARDIDALEAQLRTAAQAGRYAEALVIAERMLPLVRQRYGEASDRYVTNLNNIAAFNLEIGRYAAAEPAFLEAIRIGERTVGPNHRSLAPATGNLGQVYQAMGRLSEAEPLLLRSLAIAERNRGEPSLLAAATNNLAVFYLEAGRLAEAEDMQRAALVLAERVHGANAAVTALHLSNLAATLAKRQRLRDALPLFERSLEISLRTQGLKHPDVAFRFNNLADTLRLLGRLAEAEPLFKRSIEVGEATLGPSHPEQARALSNLAHLYQSLKRYSEAEALQRRTLAIDEKAYGADHPRIAIRIHNLGSVLSAAGRPAEAAALFERAVALVERLTGPEHPDLISSLSSLAIARLDLGNPEAGLLAARRAAGIAHARADRAFAGGRVDTRSDSAAELQSGARAFALVLSGAADLVAVRPGEQATLAEETFRAAQLADETAAGAAVEMLAQREAAGTPQLAEIIRLRQDLVAQHRIADGQLVQASAAGARGEQAKADLRKQMASLEGRLADIDARLKREHIGYAALARPSPMTMAEATTLIGRDEALVQLGFLGNAVHVWVVTSEARRWHVTRVKSDAVGRMIDALTCGVDGSVWGDVSVWNDASRCRTAVARPFSAEDAASGKLPPFDAANAYALYRLLLAPIESHLRNPDGSWKSLILVPGGLIRLPFNALVTEDPRGADDTRPETLRALKWLGIRQPVTIVPTLASFKVLRQVQRARTAPRPYLGFGNPLLEGEPGNASDAQRANLSRTLASCIGLTQPRQEVATRGWRAALAPTLSAGTASAAELRRQAPLPESASELCRVAASVGIPEEDSEVAVLLGQRMTEVTIKSMSARGELALFRTLHFATHGALAGEVGGINEPGLTFTPPTRATADDDGYLTATEIAGLKLNADWVILSACNTAGGSGSDSSALSGLARAFLYAGARALLVSHWPVDSQAAVKLVTAAVPQTTADARGRAAALQLAMRHLAERGSPREAHPAIWAPFFVVGEGAAGR